MLLSLNRKKFRKISDRIPTFLYFCLTVFSFVTLMVAKQDYDARRSMINPTESIAIQLPSTKPKLSQESVDIALAMYNIEVPSNVKKPYYDPTFEDRGLTTLRGWGKKLEVSVGPAAFESWALLGSTLAHEIEVHCKQNFTAIRIQDLVGLDGTSNAEREAYSHELSNAERFGLSDKEAASIEATMNFYYPESGDLAL
ncbi:MAG: hypothetical protein HRU19_06165 [Pseudobacteriovorax sp.]|nr:hypothetical protein [Pseudobacteriovorax sp.]